jgi:putative DNA primase/helicase
MLVEPSDNQTFAVGRVLDLLEGVAKTQSGWMARCPAHEDKHPSLSIALGEEGGVLLHCFACCPRERITNALHLHERDLQSSRFTGSKRRRPARPMGGHADEPGTAGVTLAQLAAAKRLPVEFLKGLGCADLRGPSVHVPYYGTDGSLFANRSRLALAGDRFRWRKGDHPLPYGLWRLPAVRTAGWLLLVEGETDCWTLWHSGIPALGIPGKNTWRAEWTEYVKGFEVFLWQEPDAEDLVDRVGRDLADLRVIVAPAGTKDRRRLMFAVTTSRSLSIG